MQTKEDQLIGQINGFFGDRAPTASVSEQDFDRFMGFILRAGELSSLLAIKAVIEQLKLAGTKQVGPFYWQCDGNVNLSCLEPAAGAAMRLILTAPLDDRLYQDLQRVLAVLLNATAAMTALAIGLECEPALPKGRVDEILEILGDQVREEQRRLPNTDPMYRATKVATAA